MLSISFNSHCTLDADAASDILVSFFRFLQYTRSLVFANPKSTVDFYFSCTVSSVQRIAEKIAHKSDKSAFLDSNNNSNHKWYMCMHKVKNKRMKKMNWSFTGTAAYFQILDDFSIRIIFFLPSKVVCVSPSVRKHTTKNVRMAGFSCAMFRKYYSCIEHSACIALHILSLCIYYDCCCCVYYKYVCILLYWVINAALRSNNI